MIIDELIWAHMKVLPSWLLHRIHRFMKNNCIEQDRKTAKSCCSVVYVTK